MADHDDVSERDHSTCLCDGGSSSYEQILSDVVTGVEVDTDMDHPPSGFINTPMMLCFGNSDYWQPLVQEKELHQIQHLSSAFNDSGLTCKASRRTKKAKTIEEPTSGKHKKQASKQRLGERIATVWKGTASVLHEAMGYIRFLHDQVQMLSSVLLPLLPNLKREIIEWKLQERA